MSRHEENETQKMIQLALSKAGKTTVFRNNLGTAQHKDGSWVKYGVCNPGGSDLIGWTSVEITPDMVGKKVAVFTAIECKSVSGRKKKEQVHFINVVLKMGGRAGFATTESEALNLVKF